MVSIQAEIPAQAGKTSPRRLFAFGFVKVKLGAQASAPAANPAELNVLGLLVLEDQDKQEEPVQIVIE